MTIASLPLKEHLKNYTLNLLRIPSITGNEEKIAQYLENWAYTQIFLEPKDITRYKNALLIGKIYPYKPIIALVGHLDTVHSHEVHNKPKQNGDHIIGLGASDMKSSIAVMQVLFERLDITTLPYSVLLILYDKEEGNFSENGLEDILKEFSFLKNIDLAIVMEPTDNSIQLGSLGGIQAQLIFKGKSSHSARPWEGINAIHNVAPLLSYLQNRSTHDVKIEELIFRESMSITMANGGHSKNIIPDTFTLNLNYRFAPSSNDIEKTIEKAINTLNNTIKNIDENIEINILDIAPPCPVSLNNPIFKHIQSITNIPIKPKQAWTDVARFAMYGINALNYGPGFGNQAHQKGEYCSLNMIENSFKTLSTILEKPLEIVND